SSFISKSELAYLVSRYNSTIAGTLTPGGKVPGPTAGQRYPTITLPANYVLGDSFSSQDVRVTKTFRLKEKIDVRLIGEVFNIFNISNLSNFNFNLVGPFRQPNHRVAQTFTSRPPRAF